LLALYSSKAVASEYSDNQAIKHYNRGVSNHEKGYTKSAVAEYKKAIQYNPALSVNKDNT